ncbi:hypothetical protein SAY86_015032 [Trapa natans]|uniref:Uncharacterized protein n=1 Tax=Trapa natans TaxID=22666 RepID=A0AAN7QGK2_TRANT|nr:hypothetical protein SAY86_015032 [Trapa natans]
MSCHLCLLPDLRINNGIARSISLNLRTHLSHSLPVVQICWNGNHVGVIHAGGSWDWAMATRRVPLRVWLGLQSTMGLLVGGNHTSSRFCTR